MEPTGGSVADFVDGASSATRRRDARTLIGMMRDITGREPVLWGTIIGFGRCHYRYPTGTEGEMPLLAFAPRKPSTTVYVTVADHAEALERLGPHTSSVACLYLTDLEKVDAAVLRGILERAYATAIGGGDENAVLTVTG